MIASAGALPQPHTKRDTLALEAPLENWNARLKVISNSQHDGLERMPDVTIVHTAAFVGGECVTMCCCSFRTGLISLSSHERLLGVTKFIES